MQAQSEREADHSYSIADLARSVREEVEQGDVGGIVDKCGSLTSRFKCADDVERARMLAEEPPSLGDRRWDAFMAALAEWLGVHFDLPRPKWVFKAERYLDFGWWVADHWTSQAWEFAGSPGSFQIRGIYIHREHLLSL